MPRRKKDWVPPEKPAVVIPSPAKIVDMIAADIENRLGLGSEWKRIDFDVREDIKEKWAQMISKGIRPPRVVQPKESTDAVAPDAIAAE